MTGIDATHPLKESADAELDRKVRKADLRHRMDGLRRAASPGQRVKSSEAACERMVRHPRFQSARTLALFSSIREEVETAPLARETLRRGARLVYPRVEGEQIVFREIRGEEDFVPSRFGMLEPAPSCPKVEWDALDFVLVPGLAFDPRGNRLGYGKGFYDRALGRLRPEALTVGFCHDFQILDRVPAGPGDVPVQEIVSGERHVRCERQVES